MLMREWGVESNGTLPNLSIPSKTAAWVPEFAVEDLPSAELQCRSLRLQWRSCPWAEHTDSDDDDTSNLMRMEHLEICILNLISKFYLGN